MRNHLIIVVSEAKRLSLKRNTFITSLFSIEGLVQQSSGTHCGWRCKEMCQHQDNSESSSPESVAREQNPAMFTKEEHEPHGLVKGMALGGSPGPDSG